MKTTKLLSVVLLLLAALFAGCMPRPLPVDCSDTYDCWPRCPTVDCINPSNCWPCRPPVDCIDPSDCWPHHPPVDCVGTSGCLPPVPPVDCSDIYHQDTSSPSGVYNIHPTGSTSAVQVYCDMTSEGGRWTVFQRRVDGSLNFYRPWNQYRLGFGSADGEHWLGLENIHQLAHQRSYELLVDMEDFEGNTVSARYSSFSIDAESDGYQLHVSGFTNGGAGDSLSGHSGMKFSTFDKDQDTWSGNCARSFMGAFWYTSCHTANPNGAYRWGADGTFYAVGVVWYNWKGLDYSLKTISMKIRPV